MTDTSQVSIVELCKQIGLHYGDDQNSQPGSDNGTVETENWDEPDFLSIVLAKISELTGVRREDAAEFIHRCSCGANWSEWKRADGSIWPDISHVAKELIALVNQGITQQLCHWLATNHPISAKKLGVPVREIRTRSLAEDVSRTASSPDGMTEGLDVLPDGYYEPSVLATHYQLPLDAFRNRLKRWRTGRLDGFEVREERKPRQEKYLYNHHEIWPIIESMLKKLQPNDQPTTSEKNCTE